MKKNILRCELHLYFLHTVNWKKIKAKKSVMDFLRFLGWERKTPNSLSRKCKHNYFWSKNSLKQFYPPQPLPKGDLHTAPCNWNSVFVTGHTSELHVLVTPSDWSTARQFIYFLSTQEKKELSPQSYFSSEPKNFNCFSRLVTQLQGKACCPPWLLVK